MADTKRLFFALWPDAPLREAIAQAARTAARGAGVSGKRVHDEKLHLTLAFLGELDAAAEARAVQAAATVRAPAFDLALDQVGSFFRSKVLWVGIREAPAPLTGLSQALRAALEGAGVAFDPKALAPHVTCFRDARPPLRPAAIEPLPWPVRDFALVHSAAGPPASLSTNIGRRHLGMARQYHVVSQWRLQYVPMYRVKTVQEPGGPE